MQLPFCSLAMNDAVKCQQDDIFSFISESDAMLGDVTLERGFDTPPFREHLDLLPAVRSPTLPGKAEARRPTDVRGLESSTLLPLPPKSLSQTLQRDRASRASMERILAAATQTPEFPPGAMLSAIKNESTTDALDSATTAGTSRAHTPLGTHPHSDKPNSDPTNGTQVFVTTPVRRSLLLQPLGFKCTVDEIPSIPERSLLLTDFTNPPPLLGVALSPRKEKTRAFAFTSSRASAERKARRCGSVSGASTSTNKRRGGKERGKDTLSLHDSSYCQNNGLLTGFKPIESDTDTVCPKLPRLGVSDSRLRARKRHSTRKRARPKRFSSSTPPSFDRLPSISTSVYLPRLSRSAGSSPSVSTVTHSGGDSDSGGPFAERKPRPKGVSPVSGWDPSTGLCKPAAVRLESQTYKLTKWSYLVRVKEPCRVARRDKFVCATCNKSFHQRSNVLAHIRVHTGEKPFSCDICRLRFAQKSNMTRHRSTQHRVV